jgi:hypothetical protein
MEVSETVEKEAFANVTLQARISEREKRTVKVFVIERQITAIQSRHRSKNLQPDTKESLENHRNIV